VIISVTMENGKVRFEINTAVADGNGPATASPLITAFPGNSFKVACGGTLK
jgi:hypothetical protein